MFGAWLGDGMKIKLQSLHGVGAVLFYHIDTLVHVETFIGAVSDKGFPYSRKLTRKFQHTSHKSIGEIEYEVIA